MSQFKQGAHRGRPYVVSIFVGAALVAALPDKFRLRVWREGAHRGRPYAMSIFVEIEGALDSKA